jgi:hypothetical protein
MKESTTFDQFEKGKKGGAAKAKKGPAKSFHLEKLDNGFKSTTYHEEPVSATKGKEIRGAVMGPAMTGMEHPDVAHAAAHMATMFGGVPPTDKSSEAEKPTAADTKAGDPDDDKD